MEKKQVDIEFIAQLLNTFADTVGIKIPGDINNKEDIVKAFKVIKDKFNSLSGNADRSTAFMDTKKSGKVLVVDDLHLVTYQIKLLLTRYGYEVTTSRNVQDAVEKFTNDKFDIAIMDYFVPTEQEGIYLIKEIVKHKLNQKLSTRMVVISSAPKKDYSYFISNMGIENYIEKSAGWQEKIIEFCNT